MLHVLHFFWLLGLLDQFRVQVALRNFTYFFELCDHVEKAILFIIVLLDAIDKPDLAFDLTELLSHCVFFSTRLGSMILQILDSKFELHELSVKLLFFRLLTSSLHKGELVLILTLQCVKVRLGL